MINSELFPYNEYYFSISYDADDNQLSKHRMDAELLAESIKNVAQVIQRADEILNGQNRSIQTFVVAPANEGSLIVEFVTHLIDPIKAESILHALGFLTFGGSVTRGAINALRKINNKEIIKVHTSDQNKDAEVHLSNGEILTLPKDEAMLVASPQIRKNIKNIVSTPLFHLNNPVFKVKNRNGEDELCFSNADIKAIKQIKTKSLPPIISIITTNATFSQVNFDSSKGWKVQLNANTVVNALLCDEKFLQSISAKSQSFKKEDIFKMEIEVTTYTNDLGQESKKYKILQVLPIN